MTDDDYPDVEPPDDAIDEDELDDVDGGYIEEPDVEDIDDEGDGFHRPPREPDFAQQLRASSLAGVADDDLQELESGLYWPDVPPIALEDKLARLYKWVEGLRARYPATLGCKNGVLPPCWWRHADHVELLQALWDHERACFYDGSSPSEPIAWQRDLEWTEQRLRTLTKEAGCSSDHKDRRPTVWEPDPAVWKARLNELRVERGGKPVE